MEAVQEIYLYLLREGIWKDEMASFAHISCDHV